MQERTNASPTLPLLALGVLLSLCIIAAALFPNIVAAVILSIAGCVATWLLAGRATACW